MASEGLKAAVAAAWQWTHLILAPAALAPLPPLALQVSTALQRLDGGLIAA
jgi:hypothetical protein